MTRLTHLLLGTTTIGAMFWGISSVGAQSLDGIQVAQMMHGDKMQSQGAPAQVPGAPAQTMPGMPMSGTQGEGMQGQGMQSQGMGDHGMKPPQSSMPGMQGSAGQGQSGAMGSGGMQMMGCGMMGGGSNAGMPAQAGGMMSMQGGSPMMQMMRARGGDMPTDRIEGRIAYLHAELRITEAQMAAWKEVAAALRANAKRLTEAKSDEGQKANASLLERADAQERLLAARLESIRVLKSATAKLYLMLDDAQKRSAEELMAPYLSIS